MFLAAERGLPHDPAQHAAYVDSWIQMLQRDKHEIFRAAHDASAAVDYLLTLERSRSMSADQLSPKAAIVGDGLPAVDLSTSREIPRPKGSSKSLGDDVARSLWAAEAIVAKALGAVAKIRAPKMDDGIYRGVVLGETTHHIVQRQSAHLGIAHLKESLDGHPQVGESVRIQYGHGKGTVRESCERSKIGERGR